MYSLNVEMFGRLPLLIELHCIGMKRLAGNVCDLVVLKDTLEILNGA